MSEELEKALEQLTGTVSKMAIEVALLRQQVTSISRILWWVGAIVGLAVAGKVLSVAGI